MQVLRHQNEPGQLPFSGVPPCQFGTNALTRRAAQAKSAIQQDVRAITCFTPGTRIATKTGLVPVEKITVGDRVLTRDCGFQPVRWVGQRTVGCTNLRSTSHALPVLIRADALGPGQPERDMIVSPRHRLLTTDIVHLDLAGESEALIEAGALVGRPGIMCVLPHELSYIHILFDHHEVVLSDNLWSESFHLSTPTVTALLKDQSTAIEEIFPRIKVRTQAPLQETARPCLSREDIFARCA